MYQIQWWLSALLIFWCSVVHCVSQWQSHLTNGNSQHGINLSPPAFRLFSWTPPAPSPSSPFSGGPATCIHAQLYLLCYALFYRDCCFPIPISYIALKFYSSFNSQYHFLQKPNLLSFHLEFINGPFLYTFRYCILL